MNIPFALTQGRNLDGQDGQAVIEVQPEISLSDFLRQVLIRRRNDPDVDRDAMLTAYRADILFLEDPQQAVLQDIRHISDFVEEQRPAIGRFKKAYFTIPVSSRKGPAYIAEEFTFQQTFRNGPAVDRHKRAVPAMTQIVYGLSQHFFARPGFSHEENSRIRRPIDLLVP